MSKIKFRILASIIAVLFIVSSFSVILNIKQHKDIEDNNSNIESVINGYFGAYSELFTLNNELQTEVKTKRILVNNESSENMCYYDFSQLKIIQITAQQISSLSFCLYNTKYSVRIGEENDPNYDMMKIVNFYKLLACSIKKSNVITVGKSSYLLLRGDEYQGVLIVSKIVNKLYNIYHHAYKKYDSSKLGMFQEIVSKDKDYFDSQQYKDDSSKMRSIMSKY